MNETEPRRMPVPNGNVAIIPNETDERMTETKKPVDLVVERAIVAGQTEGFVLCARLMTGGIEVGDLPEHLRALAQIALKK